ncbi:MAG: hypothetical protein GX594_12455 [Pirellulaceae bacterium]|mgnify:CR=1 FL=1|nr:hypothetical protein [Pirellulaceae bacterium]
MTFLHLTLLTGIALVTLPIVLHLIMRQRPKRLEFPALRFIEKRHDANRRRLRLRHLLLLLLRAGAIALLAFALARPSMKLPGAIGTQEAPVAAALVFDSSPHASYKHENLTRLEAARDFGQWLLAQLPEESEIAIIDAQPGTAAAFLPDRGAAKDRIERLGVAANSRPLPETLAAAAELLKTSDLPQKEIYVFTDLSRGSWPLDQSAVMQRQIEALGDCGLYVIDVGVDNPTDYGLAETRLSAEVLSSNGSLGIESGATCLGRPDTRGVELFILDDEGEPQKRSEQNVEAVPGEIRPVEFRLGGFEPGMHQGFLRLLGEDGLPANDTRYFTFEVKPAWRLLLAAPRPAERYALFLHEALAPEIYRRRGAARFACDVIDLDVLPAKPLTDYAAVFLLDPKPLEPAVWKKLADYAGEGHGVAVFLGRNAMPIDSFNQPQAQELLPGKLLRQSRRPDGDTHLAPRDYQHPILSIFRGREGSIPWEMFPVFRYWELDQSAIGGAQAQIAGGASVIIPYNDGRPSLVERPIGRGRVLTMTTPVSDRPTERPWNLLPAGEAWPFVMLANQMASYLVGGDDARFNYIAGQTAVLQLDADRQRCGYLLFSPDGLTTQYPASLDRRELAITTTEQVGNYRLLSGGAGRLDLGFSVNYAPDQTQLERISEGELAGIFGPVKFRLARTQQQIDRDISTGRVGRELFPSLIFIVVLVLGFELLVSNRFYKE